MSLRGPSKTVIFEPLGTKEIESIVALQIARLAKLLDEQRITLDIRDDARALIATQSYDPAFGARPVKRALQRLLRDPLAEKILAGDLAAGDTVVVIARGSELGFERQAAMTPRL